MVKELSVEFELEGDENAERGTGGRGRLEIEREARSPSADSLHVRRAYGRVDGSVTPTSFAGKVVRGAGGELSIGRRATVSQRIPRYKLSE
jgi:hypothetical protein